MLFLLKREHRIAFAATFVVFINIHKTMKHFYFTLLACLFPFFNLHAEGEAEAIVDSGRWIIHFDEMTEDQLNRNTFRNMDADQNFLLVEGDSCTLQIATRGSERVAWGKKKYRILYSPHDNGLKGITLKRKVIDFKKTIKRKGALQIDFRLDNQHTHVSIRISPDNTWSTITIPDLARMRGDGVERL